MASDDLETLGRLRGLLNATRVVRGDESLPEVLAAIARTVSESLGYGTCVINVYRPAWDDFAVAAVHGSDEARRALEGTRGDVASWQPLLDKRFLRRGAYFVPHGEYEWSVEMHSWTPPVAPSDDPGAWQADDALFAPLKDADGELLGILSVDEPASGRKPTDDDLDVLVAIAEHVALTLQSAQEAARAARYREALEHLLDVSSRLTETLSIDAVLQPVARGIADALGFGTVSIDLPQPGTGALVPRCAVGWDIESRAQSAALTIDLVRPLLDAKFEIEGCYLLTSKDALERLPAGFQRTHASFNASSGPRAWNDHWLVVPLSAARAR
jgi:hypothetical protein